MIPDFGLGDKENKDGAAIKLALNLNKLMKKKNVSISQMARRVEMNKSTLHNYCNGVVPRNILSLKKMADYLEVNLTELMFGPQKSSDALIKAEILEGAYELIIRRSIDALPKNITEEK